VEELRTGTPPRLPSDIRQRLELFGRYQFDPMGSGVKSDVFTTCVIPFLEYIQASQAEQESFLRDLYDVVVDDRGGFATYGAASLTWELFGEDALRLAAAQPLIDAGIAFKLARGFPPAYILTGYEMRRFSHWLDHHYYHPPADG
jgi:hypothetical protein